MYNGFNTIILLKGQKTLTPEEFKRFKPGDTIWGDNELPEELERWSINQEKEAMLDLKKHVPHYWKTYNWIITEYALEFCECDEEGEFVQGSDFELSEKDYHGVEWDDLDRSEQEIFLRSAYAINPQTSTETKEDGAWVIVFSGFFNTVYTVAGQIIDGEIEIGDEAILRNPERENL